MIGFGEPKLSIYICVFWSGIGGLKFFLATLILFEFKLIAPTSIVMLFTAFLSESVISVTVLVLSPSD
jgi:hypothetical protein